MAYVTAEQAQPGMVLAAEVKDRRGRLLIPAGQELTAKHIQAFRMWGVSHVEVDGDGPEEDPIHEIDEATLALARAEIDDLFLNTDPGHPFLATLREICLKRRAEGLARAAGGAG